MGEGTDGMSLLIGFLVVSLSVTDAVKIYNYLVAEGIIVRNRNSVSLCGNCLRVTVGTRNENERLVEALEKYKV